MRRFEKNSFQNKFSHIYVEEGAFGYEIAQRVMSSFKGAKIVEIRDYKRVFNRSRQDRNLQKTSPKIILAVKRPPFIYPLPKQCQTYGNNNSSYTTPALNCIYNCSYCFLQGMYNTANLVLFVNHLDFFAAAKQAILKRTNKSMPLALSISHETDLLAIEKIAGYCSSWIDFAKDTPEVSIEIRSKSASYERISHIEPTDRVILAWSLSTHTISRRCEQGTPSNAARLKAAARAASDGWNIRLCFDPIIMTENWKRDYKKLLLDVFESLPKGRIKDVSFGSFRMGQTHFKRIRKKRLDCELYDQTLLESEEEIKTFMNREINQYWGPKDVPFSIEEQNTIVLDNLSPVDCK